MMRTKSGTVGGKWKRRSIAFLSLALVSAAPPPGASPEQLYSAGVAARHAGNFGEAVELLTRAVAAEPANSDAHLQLGLALMAAGSLPEAEASLRRTLELAPNSDDARIALARLEQRRGNSAAALGELERVSPTNSEAAGLRTELQRSPRLAYRWNFDLDGSYSALAGQPDWREATFQVRHQATERTALGATVEAARRFGKSDTYGEVRLDHRISDGASVYVSAGGTPDADFRPEWQIGAGGAARIRGGPNATVLTGDARQARYRAGDIQTISPGLEQYVAGGTAWLTGRVINIFDEGGRHHLGWLARGDVMAGTRTRFFAGIADAPDVSEGVVTDTFSLFGGVSADVTKRTSLRFSLAREDRARGADRTQAGIGFGFRF